MSIVNDNDGTGPWGIYIILYILSFFVKKKKKRNIKDSKIGLFTA